MSPTKPRNWTALIMVALAVMGFLSGLTIPTLRWAYTVELRLHDLERFHVSEHGEYQLKEHP